MSREIKFRTWIKDEKKYIPNFVEDNDAGDGYGPLEYDNYYLAPKTGAIVKHHNHREFGDWMYTVEGTNANREVEIEQYTGLKDKNGKEIYEGDIVRYSFINPNRTYTEPVSFGPIQDGEGYFHQEFLAWRTTYADDGTAHSSLLDLVEPNWTCEIVGNIHENKEL